MTEPVVVFRTGSDVEASVVQSLLDAHGIEASLSSDGRHAALRLSPDGPGAVRVTVRAEQADEAARLIAGFRDERQRTFAPLQEDAVDALQSAMGYCFRDRGLLEHALTHRSRAHEDVTGGVTDNESLEFLGDAVLGFAIADMLFRAYPEHDEGHKSKMKAGLVSAPTLGRLAERLDLGRSLLLGRGEEKSGGRRKPTLLADAYEALIAGIYLDGGLEQALAFIAREFGPLVAAAGGPVSTWDDHKSALQERLQADGRPLPEYVVAAESGPAHRRLFRVDLLVEGTVVASADGRTKKEAEQEAARIALTRIEP